MDEYIYPSGGDVFNFDYGYQGGFPETMKVRELEYELIRRIKAKSKYSADSWLQGGIGGNLLQPDGGGWIKGKIVLRLEFIPDPKSP